LDISNSLLIQWGYQDDCINFTVYFPLVFGNVFSIAVSGTALRWHCMAGGLFNNHFQGWFSDDYRGTIYYVAIGSI